jgi:outer membrane cobalamin receptor
MRCFPKSTLAAASALAIAPLIPAFTHAADDLLEEVIVTATLRAQSLVDVPASVTVLTVVPADAGQQHFADVLAWCPT